ncbi:OPT oligopeptide transporter protein-domain-containing protein [Phaeosphaeriaceae sp. PMI808]|nr:OPT oligopeptide transporter protein-domain-containing protein [Phaeosphaeriaceae sp. PMI808]
MDNQDLTARAVLSGLLIGVLINVSNTYCGLRVGAGGQMSMISALLGFIGFKLYLHAACLSLAENILLISVATATGCMPITAGLIQTIPALEFLIGPGEYGPLPRDIGDLIIWSLGVKQLVDKDTKSLWPGASATAYLVNTLHNTNGANKSENSGRSGGDVQWELQLQSLSLGAATSAIMSRTLALDVNLSPGFVGQGMIMGPYISMHMLSDAIVGWALLSLLVKYKGWKPSNSRRWIVRVSLASLLADSSVKLVWIALRPLWNEYGGIRQLKVSLQVLWSGYITPQFKTSSRGLISTRSLVVLFYLSVVVCIFTTSHVFGDFMPWRFTPLAVALSLPMAAVGIRSLAETDYNLDSTIVSQLVFATLISHNNPDAVIPNLISAGLAVAGANQAGDLAYDLKVGTLVGANPLAQVQRQFIGSIFGAFISCGIYKLCSLQYFIPGPIFEVPSAYLVLNTARLLPGESLPAGVLSFVIGAALISTAIIIVKIRFESHWWQGFVPSGVSFAMGIYLMPSFSITRAIDGHADNIILLASGLVIGEAVTGFLSVVLATLRVTN